MNKEAVISEIMAMPLDEQLEILAALQHQLSQQTVMEDEQEREIARRMDRIEKEGFCGRSWHGAEKDLRSRLRKIRNAQHRNR